jgi:ribosome-binding factor A
VQQGNFVLKERLRRNKDSGFVNPEFAEALYHADSGNRSSGAQAERKARQLCRQVERALNLALADRNDHLGGVSVDEVSPAPDCGHLLVRVVIPAGCALADAMNALRRETPRLRSEVATAIARKRVPELAFIPAFPDGGPDE